MRCPNCGSYIRDDSVFCNYCGQRTEASKVPQEKPIISSRPRDEDFDVAVTHDRKQGEEDRAPVHQNGWVIFAIIMASVVIGALSILMFDSIKNKQRTVVNVITTEASTEAVSTEALTTEAETKATEPESITIEEKTKEQSSEQEETSESEADIEEPSPDSSESTEEPTYPVDSDGYFVAEGITYVITGDAKAAVVSCKESAADVIVPAIVNGCQVVAVYEGAFENNGFVQYLSLPEGVAWIGNRAFSNCAALKEVVLPTTVGEMSDGAFGERTDIVIVSPQGTYAKTLADQFGLQWMEGNAIIRLE